jgi:hypothetical protein
MPAPLSLGEVLAEVPDPRNRKGAALAFALGFRRGKTPPSPASLPSSGGSTSPPSRPP